MNRISTTARTQDVQIALGGQPQRSRDCSGRLSARQADDVDTPFVESGFKIDTTF